MATNPRDYAFEFGNALVKAGLDESQWFGRLVMFGYSITGFRGNNYNEDQFRAKLKNREIVIESFVVQGNPTVTGNTVSGVAIMSGTENGTAFNERIEFRHITRPALYAGNSTFRSVASPAGEKIAESDALDGEINSFLSLPNFVLLDVLKRRETAPSWDKREYLWFIWQFNRSLESYGNGQWFGRLTGDGFVFNILDTKFTENQVAEIFRAGEGEIQIKVDTETVKYSPNEDGTTTATCRAAISGQIGDVRVPAVDYTITHQIYQVEKNGRIIWESNNSTVTK